MKTPKQAERKPMDPPFAAALLLLALLVLVFGVTPPCNVLVLGSPGGGKSLAQVRAATEETGCSINIEPHSHENSLGAGLLTHLNGYVLHDKLSEDRGLPFALGRPGKSLAATYLQADFLKAVIINQRDLATTTSSPLLDEFLPSSLMMVLTAKKPLSWLPFAFRPGTKRFDALLRLCPLKDVTDKFKPLASMNYRSLRNEVGSIVRLLESIFRSPSFRARVDGNLLIGDLIQKEAKLVIERGDADADSFRFYVLALLMNAVDYVKARGNDHGIVRFRMDEAINARLINRVALEAAAECRKYGLFLTIISQVLPSWADDLLTFCTRHEYFMLSDPALARKAAIDLVGGLRLSGDDSRAKTVAWLTDDLQNLKPGEHWIKDRQGSRKAYSRLIENPWPDWPGLRKNKNLEQLEEIHARPEHQELTWTDDDPTDEPPSATGSTPDASPPPTSSSGNSTSPKDSPAARLKKKLSGN